MKTRTGLILVIIHMVAFLFILAGKLNLGIATNIIAAVGLVVEFPGWRLGIALCHTTPGILVVTAVFNTFLYWTAGMAIDAGTRQPPVA